MGLLLILCAIAVILYCFITQQVGVGLGLLVLMPYAIWAYRDEKRRSKL